jgi:hypothetical protein
MAALGLTVAAGAAALARTAGAAPVPSRGAMVAEAAGDSIRMVATWNRTGNPSSWRVTWTGGGRAQQRTLTVPTDTFVVGRPAPGDSVLVRVEIVAVRRGLSSAAAVVERWVTTPDVPPPPPDSVQVHPDTATLLAWRDSFPASEWETRPATGWQYALEGGDSLPLPSWDAGPTLDAGYYTVICTFAVNRYTKRRQLLLSADVLPDDAAACRALADKLGAVRDA